MQEFLIKKCYVYKKKCRFDYNLSIHFQNVFNASIFIKKYCLHGYTYQFSRRTLTKLKNVYFWFNGLRKTY